MLMNRSELFIQMLVLLLLSRALELFLSYGNEKKLKAKGAIDVAPTEYEFIKYFHAFWFFFLIGEFNNHGNPQPLNIFIPLAILLAISQFVRFGCMYSLGEFWTAKLLAVPGSQKIIKGPYRYVAHPTYAVVFLEFILVPLLFKLEYTLYIFGFVNLLVLANRVRLENKIWRGEFNIGK
jgi:methyltransferase